MEGNPPPEVQFFKVGINFKLCRCGKWGCDKKNMFQGFKDLNMEPRYRTWTDGASNQVYIEKYFYGLKHIEFVKRVISCVSNVIVFH